MIEQYNVNDVELSSVFVMPHKVLKNNYIKEFQFKIINKYLPTNSLLYKMHKVPSYCCTFCHFVKETMVHLFVDCFYTKNFWMKVREHYNILRDVNLNEYIILYGSIRYDDVCNKIILYAKYYIWKCRLNENRPVFENYKKIHNLS